MTSIKLTDRQVKIKAGLDAGTSVSEIARTASVSRSAVYATARRLVELDPKWKSKTAMPERSLGHKKSTIAAPPELGPTDEIRVAIARRQQVIEAEVHALTQEAGMLAAAEEALA